MGYSLEQLASDIKTSIKSKPGDDGRKDACRHVERVLRDEEFVSRYLADRPAGTDHRAVIYEDPELGFCICAHVFQSAAHGSPHDHGSSWAIYGQAVGETVMTDWRIVEKGAGDKPTLVERDVSYTMKPGDAHYYPIGFVHSPSRDKPVKLIRIEGANLDHVKRSNIKEKK